MAITFNSAGSFKGVANDNIADLANPTSLQFGPDGRLYVAEQGGRINAFTVTLQNGQYVATAQEELKLPNGGGVVKSIMNHNDDGSLQPFIGDRQVTGMLVTGTAANPVLYISSSDPRIAANGEQNLDTNSGIVTRVTKTANGWDAVDILRGLPRSEENHANNGMVLSPDGTKLYLAVGGNTNNGAPSQYFSYTGEYALSGTVLEIDLPAINSLPILTDTDGSQINGTAQPRQYIYDLPTLDDPNVPNVTGGVGENAAGLDENGPFGGNDGLNMAILPANAPLRIYADGFRNPYDLVLTASGKLYTVDNGSNGGLGGDPLIVNGEATNTPVNGGVGDAEPLFSIQDGAYYGHPSPARSNQNLAWTVYNNSGTADTNVPTNSVPDLSALVPAAFRNPSAPNYIPPGFLIAPSKFTGNTTRLLQSGIRVPYGSPASKSLVEIGSSSNGLVEYTANTYGGALQGALLVAQFNNTITLLNVNNAGTGLTPLIDPGPNGILETSEGNPLAGDDFILDADGIYTLISGLSTPLDVTMGPNGSIWVAEIGGDFIKAYVPASAGPPLPSNDIDQDGILNAVDPFVRDASNGTGVTLFPGQTLVWDLDPNQDNNLPGPNGYGGGLTGVMINGTTDFEQFFLSPSTLPQQNIKLDNVKFITAAGGGTTVIENVSNGDATGAANTGEYLFHTGFKLAPTIESFKIKWSVINPLLTGPNTGPNQQIGGYIGTGDQSNYLKLVATANPAGEIQIVLEDNDVVKSQVFLQANDLFTVPVDQQIFFELTIDPVAGTAMPTITYETGGGSTKTVTGAAINLSGTKVLNAIRGTNSVQGQTTGLAVGLYSSNVGQPPAPNGSFQAIFTDIEVTGIGNSAATVLYRVNAGGPTISAIDGGPNWLADTPFLLNPGSNTVAAFPAVEPGPTVLPSTPGLIFDTERWDAGGGTEMQYGFAVTPGTYEVRLYMGNGFSGTALAGQRVFDVAIEGTVLPSLNNIDLAAKFGNLTGGVLSNVVQVTDGTLNIDFLHDIAENPLVNGIEIIQLGALPATPVISIVGGPYSVSEAGGQVQISLLSDVIVPSAQTVTVNYEIVPGTATPQVDYSGPAGSLFLPETGKYTGTATIAGSSADATFLVSIPQDTLVEGNETFTVNITSVSSNALIGTGSTTVTIVDDDVLPSNVVVAINSGGPALIQNGISFVADTAFLSGGTYTDGTFDADQPSFNGTIYETERNAGAALGAFNYSIPVAAGNYTVELYFAEIFQTAPATRVFDVLVEGQLVLDNFDILTQNGGNINQPVIFTVPGTVSPNTFGAADAIDIGFTTSVDQAKVSGIVIRSATAPANTVNIAATSQAAEPSSNGLFTVSLSQTATTNTVVAYSVAGTATAGSDYTALSGTVTIPANQLSATIPVSVLDDPTVEGAESVIVTLTGVTGSAGVALGTTTAATVNIADNDVPAGGTITVQAESITNISGYRLESNPAAAGGSMLSLVGGASTETGTATFGFAGASGTYNVILGTFDENDGVSTLQVSKNDTSIGSVLLNQNLGSSVPNATTKVEKTVATGVTLTTGDTIKVTGIENASEHARFDFIRFEAAGPAVPAVSIAATTQAAEPSSNGLFTVSLSQAATTSTVVAYSVAGTATAGSDYTALSGTVTIPANQLSATIPVSVLDDQTAEGAESVIVTLTGTTGSNAVLGGTKTATVVISDNETPPLSTLTFQAETADTIVNYRTEAIGAASGGQVLSFLGGASGESGSASFVFGNTPDELAGTYNIILGTFDENDGVASFTVQFKDFETGTTSQIGSLTLNANLGSNLANTQTFVSPTVSFGVNLTAGDILTVNGFENNSRACSLGLFTASAHCLTLAGKRSEYARLPDNRSGQRERFLFMTRIFSLLELGILNS